MAKLFSNTEQTSYYLLLSYLIFYFPEATELIFFNRWSKVNAENQHSWSKDGETNKDLNPKANRAYAQQGQTTVRKSTALKTKFCSYSTDQAEPSFGTANHEQDCCIWNSDSRKRQSLLRNGKWHSASSMSHGVISHKVLEQVLVIIFYPKWKVDQLTWLSGNELRYSVGQRSTRVWSPY